MSKGEYVFRQNGGSVRPFSFYCDEWLRLSKVTLKESTIVKYKGIIEKHIKPCLGGLPPMQVSTDVICDFRDELLFSKKLSSKTSKDIMVLMHTILNFTQKQLGSTAVEVEIIYPKEQKREMRILDKEEQERLITYLLSAPDNCSFGILLTMFTGMRIGEICALRWENISLAEKAIKITSTMQRLQDINSSGHKTRIVIGAPKSAKSNRVIPLTAQAFSLCEKMDPRNPAAYVLTGTEKYMEPRALQYRFGKITKECGIEGVHFHTLRHTFATRCVEVGFDIKTLSEILGHAMVTVYLTLATHPVSRNIHL